MLHEISFYSKSYLHTQQHTRKWMNADGERFVCKWGTIPQQQASTNDNHFTVLPFSANNGEPVMLDIIFKAKEALKAEWETGMDIFEVGERSQDDLDSIIANSGEAKSLPGGPKCMFRGMEIPCACFL